MPAASAGNILFSKLVAFKETTAGTIPTLTSGGRKLLVTPTGAITTGTTIELGTDRSVALRNPLIGSTGTIVSTEPTISATVPAVSVGELPIWLSMTKTVAPSGTAAPYGYDYDYSMGTAVNNPKTYTLVATDGTQQYALNYTLAESITIAADRSGLTSLSANLFSQAIAKSSATLADGTPASAFMAGRLWKAYTHTSFPGTADGSAYSYLLDFSLEFNSGIMKNAYLAGTTSFSTHSESGPFTGTLTMTVSSTSSAVTAWYDNLQAATPTYVRLSWNEGGTYPVHILAAVVPTDVQVMAGAEDGLTTMAVTATLVYDTSATKSLRIVVNSDLSALP